MDKRQITVAGHTATLRLYGEEYIEGTCEYICDCGYRTGICTNEHKAEMAIRADHLNKIAREYGMRIMEYAETHLKEDK